jgi:hypothetical protein
MFYQQCDSHVLTACGREQLALSSCSISDFDHHVLAANR